MPYSFDNHFLPQISTPPQVPWEFLFIEVMFILGFVLVALSLLLVCTRILIRQPQNSSFFHHQNTAKTNSYILHFVFIGICIFFAFTFFYISLLVSYALFHKKVLPLFAFLNFDIFLSSFESLFAFCLTGMLLGVLTYRYFKFRRESNNYDSFKKDFGIVKYDDPQINTIVEEMAIASNTQKPLVFFLKDESINAFVTILKKDDQEQYALVLTRGLLLNLDRDEVQAVIAHEFSHIANQDIQSALKLAGYIFCLDFCTILGLSSLQSILKTKRSSSKKDDGVRLAFLFGIIMIFLGSIGSLGARFLQALFSRQREFLADSSAVQYTRNPEALLNALKKIDKLEKNKPLQSKNKKALSVYSHMCFLSVFRGFFSTHPPLQQRIDRLKEILKIK